ncbi:MAG: hypothetical protein R6V53_02320 [Candidatus Woesearchaeota archaeon]
MNSFSHILSEIHSLNIQGAQAIAIAGLDALLAAKNEGIDLKEARDRLFEVRATEPLLRNAVGYALQRQDLVSGVKEGKDILNKGHKRLCEYGAHKIRNGMVIYTHCHSSTVVGILEKAWKEKRFEVHNTETRPRFQGRKTAKELAGLGIPVTHYVDSAMHYALSKADMVLIGCDALSCEGSVANKVGSDVICGLAHKLDIPVYSCTHSWKFDPLSVVGYDEEIEQRDPEEVWEEAPVGIKVKNPAFSFVHPDIISGVITELGVYRPELIVEELKKKNKWMFKR